MDRFLHPVGLSLNWFLAASLSSQSSQPSELANDSLANVLQIQSTDSFDLSALKYNAYAIFFLLVLTLRRRS